MWFLEIWLLDGSIIWFAEATESVSSYEIFKFPRVIVNESSVESLICEVLEVRMLGEICEGTKLSRLPC